MEKNENDVNLGSSPEKVVEPVVTPTVSEDPKTPNTSAPQTEEKMVPYSRFKEVNDQLSELKGKPAQNNKEVKSSLDVEDYINISASLEGLDQREKEYLAQQHKLTGKPMAEIRKGEDFNFWQSAYRQKVEKERATLAPNNRQTEAERPKSFEERLAGASLEEKEKLLVENGLYRPPRGQSGRTRIGGI